MTAGKRRRIGRTAIEVTEMGLGGAPLGNLMGALGDREAGATIEAGLGGGVGYFDTAPFYGYGLSERRMGNALRHRDRDGFVLSSKVGRLLTPTPDAVTFVTTIADVVVFVLFFKAMSTYANRALSRGASAPPPAPSSAW